MDSVLSEVMKLRNASTTTIDHKNSNRYRVVLNENNGTKTAYCFSTPIYNNISRKMIDLRFHNNEGIISTTGSNTITTYSNTITMENTEGHCIIYLDNDITYFSETEIKSGANILLPTTNGFVYKMVTANDNRLYFDLEVDKSFGEIRSNDKYFSLMSEKFRPFVTVSCIGTTDIYGQVIAPAKLSYQKLSNFKYRLMVTPCSPLSKYVMIEVNLYETKLLQDTTVESNNPTINNAFGTTAFIGNTAEFGEQWLYTRVDYTKLSDLFDKRVNRVVLHLPKHNKSNVELSAFNVLTRFCSFGSTWNNKISDAGQISDLIADTNHHHIDLTESLVDKFGRLTQADGLILKTKKKGEGFSVIATGDGCYAPQIFEINYK